MGRKKAGRWGCFKGGKERKKKGRGISATDPSEPSSIHYPNRCDDAAEEREGGRKKQKGGRRKKVIVGKTTYLSRAILFCPKIILHRSAGLRSGGGKRKKV